MGLFGGSNKTYQTHTSQDNRVLNELGVGAKQENIELSGLTTGENSSLTINMRDDKAQQTLQKLMEESNRVVKTSQENSGQMLQNMASLLDNNKNDNTQNNFVLLAGIVACVIAVVKIFK